MGASSRSHADTFFMAHFFVLILPVFSTKSLHIGFWRSRIRNVGMGFPYLFQNCTTEYRFRFRAPAVAVPTDAGVPVLWSSGRCGWFQCWNGPRCPPALQCPCRPGNKSWQTDAGDYGEIPWRAPHRLFDRAASSQPRSGIAPWAFRLW